MGVVFCGSIEISGDLPIPRKARTKPMKASHKRLTPLHELVLTASDPLGLVLDRMGSDSPRFSPGTVVTTPAVRAWAGENKINLLAFAAMHLGGYWGNLDLHDVRVNENSIKQGMRIMSSYPQPSNGQDLWIITEADRSYTTILFASEY